MERTKEEKRKDVKLSVDTVSLIIGCFEDMEISTLERAARMVTIIQSVILKVRADEKGGVH